MFSCSRNAQITFGEKPQIKIISFQNCTHEYLIHTWTEKSFKGTIVNRALSSLHKGSPAVTLTVSIKDRGKIIFSLSLSLSLSPSLSLQFPPLSPLLSLHFPLHFPFTFPFTFPFNFNCFQAHLDTNFISELFSEQSNVEDLRYFKLVISVRSKNTSFKYQRFKPSGCKYIAIKIFDFVTKTQFL